MAFFWSRQRSSRQEACFTSPFFFFLAFFPNCGAWSQATSQLLIFCSAMQSTVFKRSNLMFYILHLVNFSYSLIIFYYFQLTWLITFICVLITVGGLHFNVGCQEQKHFFPLVTKLCYHKKNFEKQMYCIRIDHQRLVTWLQTKNLKYISPVSPEVASPR